MLVIGLTGGIASGKSTVSNYMREKGIPIIDADIVAREILLDNPSLMNAIRREISSDVFDESGNLIRRKLGNIVFKDNEKLKVLNRITHPVIKEHIKEKINELKTNGIDICVVDAAILIESNFIDIVDIVILVFVSREVQINRLIKRDNLRYEEAISRINSQMDLEEKKKYANFLIDNSYNLESTLKQVDNIILKIKSYTFTTVESTTNFRNREY